MACVQFNKVPEKTCDYSNVQFTLSSKGYVYSNDGHSIAPLVIELAPQTVVVSPMDGYPGKISVGVREETQMFLKAVIDKYCTVNSIDDKSVTKKYPNLQYNTLVIKLNNDFKGGKYLKTTLIKPKVYDFSPEGTRIVGVTLYAMGDVVAE